MSTVQKFLSGFELGGVILPAEKSYRDAREYLRGGRIYVEPSVIADFGDDWADIPTQIFVDFNTEK